MDDEGLRSAPDELPPAGKARLIVLEAPWLPWCLVVVVVLPMAALAVGTYRTLRGEGLFFEDGAPSEVYTRIAVVVMGQVPEIRLVPPLLGLAAIAWLLHRRADATTTAVRNTAAAVAGVLTLEAAGLVAALSYLILVEPVGNPDASFFLPSAKLDQLAPPLVSCLTLTCLAALLGHAMYDDGADRSAIASAAPGPDSASTPVAPGMIEFEDSAESAARTAPAGPGSLRLTSSVAPKPAKPAEADLHAAYRRPP